MAARAHRPDVALVVACVVAPLALIGSAASLYEIACDAHLALPLALPVALDLTAMAAAAQIRSRRRLALSWATLVGGVLLSAGLQIEGAWERGAVACVVHGSLPLAALVAFELALPEKPKARRRTPVKAKAPQARTRKPRPPVAVAA